MVRRQSSGSDILDAAGRPGNPRIVDQRVKSAKRGFDVIEQTGHVRFRGDVGLGDSGLGMGGAVVGEELVGDVADMDLRAASDEQVGGRAPNARCARGDENAQLLRESKDVSGNRSFSHSDNHVRLSRSAITATRTTRPNRIVRVA